MTVPFFSVLIVCLNAGDKLKKTFDSIKHQTFRDFEVLIKDGESTDGSVERLLLSEKELAESAAIPYVKVIRRRDQSIYDAMNQAVDEAKGEYLFFLNCGDVLYDENVLKKMAAVIKKEKGQGIYYGDIFSEKTNTLIAAPGKITGFTCYRNIPCHQACFYHKDLFEGICFKTDYRIRADYDHFLRCVYREGAAPLYCGFTVASYEGGGYSESRENKKRDRQEHRLITGEYMSAGALFLYKSAMLLTLAPLRRVIAESSVFSGIYQKLKKFCYRRS